MQFYARFQDEVVAAPDLIAAHVDPRPRRLGRFPPDLRRRTRRGTSKLVAAPDDLHGEGQVRDDLPPDPRGNAGLTTFKFTTDYLSREGLLPGFVDGYSKIHHDETRHIGYGVWYLRETVRAQPEAGTVRQTLRDLLPSVAAPLPARHRLRTRLRCDRREREAIRELPSAASPADSTSSASP